MRRQIQGQTNISSLPRLITRHYPIGCPYQDRPSVLRSGASAQDSLSESNTWGLAAGDPSGLGDNRVKPLQTAQNPVQTYHSCDPACTLSFERKKNPAQQEERAGRRGPPRTKFLGQTGSRWKGGADTRTLRLSSRRMRAIDLRWKWQGEHTYCSWICEDFSHVVSNSEGSAHANSGRQLWDQPTLRA